MLKPVTSVENDVTLRRKKILIIDDDMDVMRLAELVFKKAEAQVFTANDGQEGMRKLFAYQPDLILLDLVMPGIEGFEVCERIRQVSEVPVIILTAMSQDQYLLRGLNLGADDFLAKPFSAQVLLARACAVLRRAKCWSSDSANLNYDDGYLSIDSERLMVSVRGKPIAVTPVEFRLLDYLVRNAGKTLTFEQILTHVWGSEYQGSMDYVHVYISHLRNKLEEKTKSQHYIFTVHGVGYRFEKI